MTKDQCYEDADQALRKCHEQVNQEHMQAIANANAITDESAKADALKAAQDKMIDGYRLCEQAHSDELAACDAIYAD